RCVGDHIELLGCFARVEDELSVVTRARLGNTHVVAGELDDDLFSHLLGYVLAGAYARDAIPGALQEFLIALNGKLTIAFRLESGGGYRPPAALDRECLSAGDFDAVRQFGNNDLVAAGPHILTAGLEHVLSSADLIVDLYAAALVDHQGNVLIRCLNDKLALVGL